MRTPVALALLVLPALAQKTAPTVITGLDKEVAFGKRLAADAASQYKPLNDPARTGYANRIVQALAAQAALPFPVSVSLVDATRPFAAAFPGGFLVASGRLLGETSESELAAVFAHEVAHIVLQHATGLRKVGTAEFAPTPLVLTGGWSSICTRFDGQLLLPVAVQQQARESEAQADTLAAEYLARAGFDVPALPALFERLSRIRPPRPENWKPPTLRRPGEPR